MITPKEIALPEDTKGIRYSLIRAWREMVSKVNYHLIQWRDEGTDIGGVGQVNKVNFTGAGVSTAVVDDTLTVTVSGGGGGGGLSDGDYGDITVSGGATALTIDNDAVTFAKMQNISTARLLGRNTAGTGDIEEITLGTNLSFSGTTLNAAGGGTWASATANIPQGKGQYEYQQTITDAAVTASSKILLMLDPAADTDENQAEGVDLLSWMANPGTGNFVLTMQFRELHSGPIKFFYQVS